ncbi:hypothetical protein D3C80_1565670 [compost metagenome]
MKTKFLIASFLLTLAFVSCKNEEKKESVTPAVEEVKVNTFDVTVDVVLKTDDDLILYYKDGTNEWFVEEKAVWNTVKGNNEVQSVVFNLPEGVLPNDLRLDIGRNEFKGLKDIEIKKITISYLGNKFEIQQDQLETFFKPNQFISYDAATKLYSFKKDEQGNYDPFFETKPEFYPQLAKISSK